MHTMAKIKLAISCLLMINICSTVTQGQNNTLNPSWINQIADQHNMTLPDWGPYTKRYIGISHITSEKDGLRFDLSVFPGKYRGKTTLPNVMFESDFHPWEATPDLSYFSFRHELEWKDKVYADISYSTIDPKSRLIRAELINNTDLPQSLVLHFMANMNFPPIREYAANEPIYPAEAILPQGVIWTDALDYVNVNFTKKQPADDLVYDGKMRGEIRASELVNGSGLGRGFGSTAGDSVTYQFKTENDITDACLLIRYRMGKDNETTLKLGGITDLTQKFKGNGNLEAKTIALGKITKGVHQLTITAQGGKGIDLDGFTIVPQENARQVSFKTRQWDYQPEIIKGPEANSIILKYKDSEAYYGITWQEKQYQIRQFFGKELDLIFPAKVHNHVNNRFDSEGLGHFTNVFLRPLTVAPQSNKVVYAMVVTGTLPEVQQRITDADMSEQTCQSIYDNGRKKLPDLKPVPTGDKMLFSQQRMAATILTNVVYPVYTQKSYIKHYAPGRWWDCLYTWDSGFIGLGVAELDIRQALECLNAYVTKPGSQSAFIHHGSMVPVQHYLFLEIWNRTQSQEYLAFYYPRLRQYYEFFIGRLGSSTMDKFNSGLLSSFDYFYNSGGWDDYPAQKHTHNKKMGAKVSPVVNSAHAIAIARIMSMAAEALGETQDITIYQQDITRLTQSLQKFSWDQDSGYFGYVVHNDKKDPVGILRDNDGINYNMGLDGLYPLVAGAGTKEQTKSMLEKLKSPSHIWSSIGLSAVDQSAPYYRNDGYWNGTVWMPHQWFFWKALLDLGEGEFAWEVARRALELWQTEVGATYNCNEHFIIETGRGAGWHQFGALSSPVLKWYAAYFRPGTLTTGLNAWIVSENFAQDNSSLDAEIKLYCPDISSGHCSMVVCMNPAYSYAVRWNGAEIKTRTIASGIMDISVPLQNSNGILSIKINAKP